MPYNHISGRIAIFYPWGNLDTVPSLRNAAILLTIYNYKVEFYTLQDHCYPQPIFDDPGISVFSGTPAMFSEKGVVRPRCARFLPGRVHRFLTTQFYRPVMRRFSIGPDFERRHASIPYTAIIGVDPEGLTDASLFAKRLDVPLIYWSLELLFMDEITTKQQKMLKYNEIVLSRKSAFTIIQDKWRAQALIEENGISADKIVLVPNSPLGKAKRSSNSFLHDRLKIDRDRKIVLCAGTITGWAMSKEVVEAARTWPHEFVLVMHSRRSAYGPLYGEYHEAVFHSADPSNVVFSFEPVHANQLPDLVGSADIGVAFYSPSLLPNGTEKLQKNLEIMGFSSGKLATYLKCGLPIVTNAENGFRSLIESYNCGVWVTHPSETKDALQKIMAHYNNFSFNACRCFNEKLEFEAHFDQVIERIRELTTDHSS